MTIPKTTGAKPSGPLAQFEQILKRASEKKASDVHLKAGLPPIVRVNGNLYYLGEEAGEQISRLTNAQLLSYANALMNDRQRARYEAGDEVDLGFEVAGMGRFRINICQQRSFPRLVCRHIPDQIRTIKELDLPPIVEELTLHERGLVLVTGATGSGKSTTLAAMIDHIARNTSSHIITLEDPIEFGFKDRKSIVTQREIGMDTKSFALALKYALRQDPDVILVGEMRDEETILMAMSAAETGHLVFSTLHTNDAAETINRILGSISSSLQAQARAQLASVLIGVISQRLLISKDGKGRVAAVEALVTNQRVRDMILDPKRTADIHRVIEESQSMGMQSFDQSLMALVKADKISIEEAMNACTNLQDFQLRLEGVVAGDWQEQDQHQEPTVTRAQRIKDALNSDNNVSQAIEIEQLPLKKKSG